MNKKKIKKIRSNLGQALAREQSNRRDIEARISSILISLDESPFFSSVAKQSGIHKNKTGLADEALKQWHNLHCIDIKEAFSLQGEVRKSYCGAAWYAVFSINIES